MKFKILIMILSIIQSPKPTILENKTNYCLKSYPKRNLINLWLQNHCKGGLVSKITTPQIHKTYLNSNIQSSHTKKASQSWPYRRQVVDIFIGKTSG